MRRLAALTLLTLQLWSLAGTALCSTGCATVTAAGDPDCPDALAMHAAASGANVAPTAGTTVAEMKLVGVTDCALGPSCSVIGLTAPAPAAPLGSAIPSPGAPGWAHTAPVTIERSAPPLPPPNS